jgi:hypothetical protein
MHARRFILLMATLVSLCRLSIAAPDPLADDPRRPVAAISQDLGVQPREFRACFANVTPAPAGQKPDAARVRSNKAKLFGCLKTANPQLTNEKLDAVMDKYRPGGRAAQAQ